MQTKLLVVSMFGVLTGRSSHYLTLILIYSLNNLACMGTLTLFAPKSSKVWFSLLMCKELIHASLVRINKKCMHSEADRSTL